MGNDTYELPQNMGLIECSFRQTAEVLVYRSSSDVP